MRGLSGAAKVQALCGLCVPLPLSVIYFDPWGTGIRFRLAGAVFRGKSARCARAREAEAFTFA